MKRKIKAFACLGASLIMCSSTAFAKTQLYALDGRTLYVEDNQIDTYTAPGMGWFKEAPVTMYAIDGRSLIVPADQVEAHQNVGWYLKEDLDKYNAQQNEAVENNEKPNDETIKNNENESSQIDGKVYIKYTDNTVVCVPEHHLETYKLLGWVLIDGDDASSSTVIMYNADGETKEVSVGEIQKYENAGWSINKPDSKLTTVYLHDGTTKNVKETEVDSYKAKGWGVTYDEAVYNFAAKGDGGENAGAVKLLEEKKYELAFNYVQDAIEKLENTESEYLSMLYYLRSSVTDAWREAANSPLGFINYWFNDKDGKRIVVFEYRNVSNSQIQTFKINFDLCDKDGNVIETNSKPYAVSNLKMNPCDKKRVGWTIERGEEVVLVKNVKVHEVTFADGTIWKTSK